jgi:hypothetical protein
MEEPHWFEYNTQAMNIPSTEYTQPRTLFQHCEWINQKLQELQTTPEFYVAYFERKGMNIKRFIEEAVPVAYLGLHFWRTWREIMITCLAGNEPHDAVIDIRGARGEISIHVEVTTVETAESTMRRQAIARNGTVPLTGPIVREGRKIHAALQWVDVDVECTQLLDLAFERFRLKAEQERDPQTAILVYVDTHQLIPLRHRHHLVERTRHYLLQHSPSVYGVYYCYDPSLGIDALRNERETLW